MAKKFTQKAQNALCRSLTVAEEMGHTYIGSEHLLLALSSEKDSISYNILSSRGAEYEVLKKKLTEVSGVGCISSLCSSDMSATLRKIIDSTVPIQKENSVAVIGTEDLLSAILARRDCVAVKLLEACGISLRELRADLCAYTGTSADKQRSRKSDEKKDSRSQIKGAPTLSLYGKDLTAEAAENKIDPIIGRDTETEHVIRILSRRTKNNPCLVGEPGVGKTAVIEGLALRINAGNIPENLKNKRIISLDIPAMIAGAKYRGEFEERMKAVMDEVMSVNDIILFVDEFHTIVGAGAAEGALDAANIIKPALARGELQLIGATTLSEYRAHIEKDAALERRFQSVNVNEPTEAESKDILFGLRDKYEKHHSLKISDEAIDAAVKLSARYIPDRFLPDKAIDLIDEAAAKLRISTLNAPICITEAERELEDILEKKELAVSEQNFELAQKLRLRELTLYKKIDISKNKAEASLYDPDLCVSAEDIADIVRSWTGIPVSRLLEEEENKLLTLNEKLSESIIGQDAAIDAVCRAIRRGRLGLKDPNRPIGSFIFLGRTGVGKTELSKALAATMFGSSDAMIRLDMSEYMEKHSVSKLIGAPPGYVGYGEGGLLTEKVRRRPYSLILFDEIEKAHPDVFNILLSVLEDGALTDSSGRRVDFKNTVIIMTSNTGAAHINHISLGFSSSDSKSIQQSYNESVKIELKNTFRPEFLNRIDEIIVFNSLSVSDIEKISDKMLKELSCRARNIGISIEFDSSVPKHLSYEIYDEKYGARSVRREIVHRIEDTLSSLMIEGKISRGDNILAFVDDKEIIFEKNGKPIPTPSLCY